MRNIIFKNLTSLDRKKRIITSDENFEKSGVCTHIRRRLICLIKEIRPEEKVSLPAPYLYVLKERNHLQQREKFLFRLKGSLYAFSNEHLYLITFLHSLKINMQVLAQQNIG